LPAPCVIWFSTITSPVCVDPPLFVFQPCPVKRRRGLHCCAPSAAGVVLVRIRASVDVALILRVSVSAALKPCVPTNVLAASVRAMVALVVGNVIVVLSVPANVNVLLMVATFPDAIARVPGKVRLAPDPAVVNNVPEVGSVTPVVPVAVNVTAKAPDVISEALLGMVSVPVVDVIVRPLTVLLVSASEPARVASVPVVGNVTFVVFVVVSVSEKLPLVIRLLASVSVLPCHKPPMKSVAVVVLSEVIAPALLTMNLPAP